MAFGMLAVLEMLEHDIASKELWSVGTCTGGSGILSESLLG
jgi:hypothetical protein